MTTPPPRPAFVDAAELERPATARFEDLARARPAAVAVRDGGAVMSYGALNAAANRVAHALLRGPGQIGDRVALLAGRGPGAIAALLGALKAGRVHLALEPAAPAERSRFMLDDAQADVVVTGAPLAALARDLAGVGRTVIALDALPEALSVGDPGLPLGGDALATLLYTSGSTGRPKGVLQDHRNTLHNMWRTVRSVDLGPDDRFSLLNSLGVMGGVRDVLAPLSSGGSIAPFDLPARGVAPLAGWIRSEGVTILNLVVTVFRHFAATLGDGDRFPSVRVVKAGSEALAPADVEAFRRHFLPPAVLWAGYGSTEAGNVAQHLVDHHMPIGAGALPLGQPLFGMELLLLDEHGEPVGPADAGEIVIRSRYLALGYWGQPDLSAAVFGDDPAGGGLRRYRTGDVGRVAPAGALVHLGRRDSMVKLRGNRVELGEIEQALLALPAIKQAAAVARAGPDGELRIVAYVAPHRRPGPTPSAVRVALAAALPAHMLPARIVELSALPSALQGKVDRRALPEPDWSSAERSEPLVPPRTPIERELARIWADVLGLAEVGVADRFLDLGGHSLLAGKVAAQVLTRFQVGLPAGAILSAATVADMADLVTGALAAAVKPDELVALLEGLSEERSS